MSNPIIGIDHGYAAMKTQNFSFPSGIVAYDHEPYTLKDVLEFGGKYYVVGSGRGGLQKEKTGTEDYYLLTLAAIAKEINHRGLPTTSTIHLAAGLPLTSFGRDKESFKNYLFREGNTVFFKYEGENFAVTVEEVSLFPQGYSGILTQASLLNQPSIIMADIGGWTVDIMRLDNKIPNASTCRSLELGMISCLDEILEQIRRITGLSLTSIQVEHFIQGNESKLEKKVEKILQTEVEKYIQKLLSAITEAGLDLRAMPTVFLGGGASLLKRHLPPMSTLHQPIILDDVSLNAKGYERLVGQFSEGKT